MSTVIINSNFDNAAKFFAQRNLFNKMQNLALEMHDDQTTEAQKVAEVGNIVAKKALLDTMELVNIMCQADQKWHDGIADYVKYHKYKQYKDFEIKSHMPVYKTLIDNLLADVQHNNGNQIIPSS